ncbi:hypothetical protein Apmu_0169_03 [Acidiphilium multivorum AIU301]|nr:hypothetical protein Apmu_0169_03 [Acidiphilium multivorum AIU301]
MSPCGGISIAWEHRRTDRGTDSHRQIPDAEWLREVIDDSLCDKFNIRSLDFRQNDCEFITAETKHHISFTDAATQAFSRGSQ